MKVLQVSIDKLIPYVNNSRTHSDDQIAQVAASIKEFGFTNPVLTDGENGIIAGHGRVLAARKLGLNTVPCIELSHLTKNQRKAYIIADNKLALNSGWDDELLKIELDELDTDGFDISLTGFTPEELDALTTTEVEGLTDEDAVPEPPVIPITKLGDVWILGKHRLMCGDSTSIDAVEKLMDGNHADICFTSPPYNAAKNSHLNGRVNGFDSKYKDNSDEMSDDDYLKLLIDSTNNSLLVCDYSFINLQLLAHNRIPLTKFQFHFIDVLKDIFIWNKSQCPPNIVKGAFNTKWEYIFCFSNNNKTRGFPCGWQGKYANVVETESNSGNKFAGVHKAGFPVNFPLWFVEKLDFIESLFDPFGGTGTTMIAAEMRNKKSYLMELDPKYCDVIVNRWEDFTGKKAVLEGDTSGTHI